MCKKTKGLHNRIDPCIRKFINYLAIILPNGIRIKGCCCGHGKYPLTIIVKENDKNYELISGRRIPRKKKFYKRDKQGFYYIPEVV